MPSPVTEVFRCPCGDEIPAGRWTEKMEEAEQAEAAMGRERIIPVCSLECRKLLDMPVII